VSTVEIIGRSSSHFTRLTQIYARELEVPYTLVPIYDITTVDATGYGDNPALKIPSLRRGGSTLFGAVNVCRALAELAPVAKRLVWPEDLRDDLSRNAHELLWHAMAAQVQLVFGTVVGKLPADNVYFAKGRAGFEGALGWLDAHVSAVRAAMPPRDLSLFEVALFCLMEHLEFRESLPVAPYPALTAFVEEMRGRPSSSATAYRYDAPA
jgi:glutathione S-transferase